MYVWIDCSIDKVTQPVISRPRVCGMTEKAPWCLIVDSTKCFFLDTSIVMISFLPNR
jgi:hypothetical protein